MVTDNKTKKRKLISVRTKPKQRQTAQKPPDAYDEDFLDRIKDFHWPRRASGPVITVGWLWNYWNNFTGGSLFVDHGCNEQIEAPPCYTVAYPVNATFACGWAAFVDVGFPLGNPSPPKVGPTIFGLPYNTSLFNTNGNPSANDVALGDGQYISRVWTQPMDRGAPSAPHFEPQFPGHPELGGAYVYRGGTSAGGTQALWGLPTDSFGGGYYLRQDLADADDAAGDCIFTGVWASSFTNNSTLVSPNGGQITAHMTGNKFVTLKPPGVLGAPTTKPVIYELYQTRVAFTIRSSNNGALASSVGGINFFLDYKVKGSPTPPIGHNIGP